MQTVKKSSWGMKGNEDTTGIDMATSSFRWDLIPPKVRFRRDVVFSFEDLIGKLNNLLAKLIYLNMYVFLQCPLAVLWPCLWALVSWVWCKWATS